MYITTTQLDIMYVVSLISGFMESPKDSHWKVNFFFFICIVGTTDYGIWYSTSKDNSLVSYINSDFIGSIDDRKSNFGYAFHLATCLISRASKKKPIVTSAKTHFLI
jgi:hypothetical protein